MRVDDLEGARPSGGQTQESKEDEESRRGEEDYRRKVDFHWTSIPPRSRRVFHRNLLASRTMSKVYVRTSTLYASSKFYGASRRREKISAREK